MISRIGALSFFVSVSPGSAAFALLLVFAAGTAVQAARPADGAKKPKADNSACYVCHEPLRTELITSVHLAERIGCRDCHGPSGDHQQDEMQMTTPDRLYGRREVDPMCRECHEQPHTEVAEKVKAFREKWQGAARPNGRTVTETSICTDCHGTHNLRMETAPKTGEQSGRWTAAFNGSDLTGWRASGNAVWRVKLGRIVASPGPNAHGGVLWSDAEFGDFLLSVTFRTDWPIHAGIYLRAGKADRGPRIEIFQSDKPVAYSGSVGLPGKGPALLNLRKDLFDPGGWNTISAKVEGDRVQVWLGGEEIGVVHVGGPAKGRIGLYLEGGRSFPNAELSVREVLIRKLAEKEGEGT